MRFCSASFSFSFNSLDFLWAFDMRAFGVRHNNARTTVRSAILGCGVLLFGLGAVPGARNGRVALRLRSWVSALVPRHRARNLESLRCLRAAATALTVWQGRAAPVSHALRSLPKKCMS